MAKIKKIQESGETIYPATIFQAIKNPENGQTLEKSFESEHKKLTAGFAYEILGDGQATSEEFSFRPTGGPNRNVRDGSARIEVLKGNSVAWNQLGIFQDSFTTTQGVTFTKVSNSELRVSGTIQTAFPSNNVPLTKTLSFQRDGRKYLISMLTPSGVAYGISGYSITNTGPFIWSASDGSTWNGNIVIKAEVGQTIDYTFKNLQIIDLTQMFGAGNEPTTVEQFYELLPIVANPTAYNEGEIIDANYKAIKTTGFNQWDEQWEKGSIDSVIGVNTPSSVNIRSKSYIGVLPNTNYYVSGPQNTGVIIFAYGSNKQPIKRLFFNTVNGSFIVPNSIAYIRFCTFQGYTNTYNNDICINIAWDEYSALNGQYKPYKPFERDLSWINKYFPNGMRSAGNVADEIRFNSTTQQWEAVQRIGVVDLGSLTYNLGSTNNSSYQRFQVAIPDIKAVSAPNLVGNILCAKYITTTADKTWASTKGISVDMYGIIGIYDEAYNNDVVIFKAAMAGVMLNYELATPDIKTITEDVNLAYDVADYGTEQLIVAEGAQSAPLSAEVVYEPNVLASIKQVAAMLTRLDALETAVATMQAPAVTNTNEE